MFGVAFVAFGVEQLLFGGLVVGRPPAWPPAWPGASLAVLAFAACYIGAGVAILTQRWSWHAAMLIAALVLTSAVLRNLPLAIADANFGSAWTRLGKGVALCGAALAIAGPASLARVGRIGFALYLIASGVQHFLFMDFVQTLVPAWIPGQRLWAQVAGVALIAGGTGLLLRPTASAAGLAVGLMVFTWFVILHIPRALAAPVAARPNEWIAVAEALAFAGIALLFARPSE